jgi:4'-phosphopantetheinyl transferase
MNKNLKFLENKIKLSDKQIHVFLLELTQFDDNDFLIFLSKDEKERESSLKVEEKKKQFLVTRGALRKLLSNSLGKPAEEISFSYGQHKKPYIEEQYNNKTVEFNISHSGDYALIAITLGNKIGVDIEKINYEIDYQSLSNRFFSKKEKEELASTNKEERLDAFYRAWVRKESFIKANGKGIAFGLDQFSVSLNENKKIKIEITSPNATNEEWYCCDLMDVDNYKTALTSCGDERSIIFSQ